MPLLPNLHTLALYYLHPDNVGSLVANYCETACRIQNFRILLGPDYCETRARILEIFGPIGLAS
jgi:hypothetical protein